MDQYLGKLKSKCYEFYVHILKFSVTLYLWQTVLCTDWHWSVDGMENHPSSLSKNTFIWPKDLCPLWLHSGAWLTLFFQLLQEESLQIHNYEHFRCFLVSILNWPSTCIVLMQLSIPLFISSILFRVTSFIGGEFGLVARSSCKTCG